jgi:hypothetical protein
MAVYLGNSGLVSIQRSGSGSYTSVLDPGDVNIAQKRFSFDFPDDTFITGDYLQITRIGGGNLDFIDANGFTPPGVTSTGAWYVNVDAVGGIRLFKTRGESLKGDAADAITLLAPGSSYTISVLVTSAGYRPLGEIVSYELSTQRAALDASVLGEEFVSQVSGLVSGSGRITCFWDFGETGDFEAAQYMHHLILRQQQLQLLVAARGIRGTHQPGQHLALRLQGFGQRRALGLLRRKRLGETGLLGLGGVDGLLRLGHAGVGLAQGGQRLGPSVLGRCGGREWGSGFRGAA